MAKPKVVHTYSVMIYLRPAERDALGLRRHISQATLQGPGYSGIDFARRAHAAGFAEGASTPEALLRSWKTMSQVEPREDLEAYRARAEAWPGAFLIMPMDLFGVLDHVVLVHADERGDFIAQPDPSAGLRQGTGGRLLR